MKYNSSRIAGFLLLATITGFFSGCGQSGKVFVSSEPSNARVRVNGTFVGSTDLVWEAVGEPPYRIQVEKDNFATEERVVNELRDDVSLRFNLQPLRITRSFTLASSPAGATIRVDGQTVGTTPDEFDVRFTRSSVTEPFSRSTVELSLPDYESETFTVSDGSRLPSSVQLGRIRHEKAYAVRAISPDGQPIAAVVSLNGREMGSTGQDGRSLDVSYTFQRSNKNAAWPRFTLSAEVPRIYKPSTQEVTYDFNRRDIVFRLEPITELQVPYSRPEVVVRNTGAVYEVVTDPRLALLDTRETLSQVATDLKPITSFERYNPDSGQRVQTVNQFTLTSDGQSVIFALTVFDPGTSSFSSNLYFKQSEDSQGGITRLTSGTRFLDANPAIGTDGSDILVFQANRMRPTRPDIFRVQLSDQRFSGGLSRITSDSQFNFNPTYASSNRELIYNSLEPDYPLATPQLNSVQLDGSLPTQLMITGDDPNFSDGRHIYFTRKDASTGKKQIYSIESDGKLETPLILDETFNRANCIQPSPSPDGSKIVFVSDVAADEQGRNNNNIFVMDSNGSNIQQITYNGSDDILPIWSSTEPNVILFVSSRGGSYNIWRLRLLTGR